MIDHVSFAVPPGKAGECATFYELLGFTRVEPPAGLGERSIWLARGSSAIHLMFRDGDGVDVEASEPGRGHVAFVVDDYDALLGLLAAAGVSTESRTAYWGAPRCYTQDPAGNRVELMAAPPQL